MIALIALAVVLVASPFVYRSFYTYVDSYEFAYKFDSMSGKLYALRDRHGKPVQGYVFAVPLLQSVHTIDMRPMQICISANSRVLNCKLVQFNVRGWRTFVDWHGRDNYSGEKLKDILMSYAYDPAGNDYTFLDVKK